MEPRQGPQAGGTTLTINGTHLDTGSKEDVRVTLNGVPCEVYVLPMAAELAWPRGKGGKALEGAVELARSTDRHLPP